MNEILPLIDDDFERELAFDLWHDTAWKEAEIEEDYQRMLGETKAQY